MKNKSSEPSAFTEMFNSETDHPPDQRGAFHALIEQSEEGMMVLDHSGTIVFANEAAHRLLHSDGGGLLGFDFGYPLARARGSVIQLLGDEGTSLSVLMEVEQTEWQGGPAHAVTLRDVSRVRQQQQEILQLSSALQTVLAIEELILREKDIEKLLHQSCSLLVQRRNYQAASAVIAEEDGTTRVIEAYDHPEMSFEFAGSAPELPPCCIPGWDKPDDGPPWRPTEQDCEFCSVSGLCQYRNRLFASIQSDVQVFGFISMVISPGSPGTHELELIQRLAADLGQAIQTRRTEIARQRAEAELRESEARFRQLFDNSVDAIMITDTDGRYLDANPAACEMFGYTRAEILNMSVADLIVPHDRSEDEGLIGQQIGKRSGTLIFFGADGTPRVAEYSLFQLSPIRFAAVLRDVTRRRALEDQLRHAQKMQAVGRLAGGIAHDFNNSLTAIISFSNFVRQDMEPSDSRRADIEQVLRAARRAADLTRQLLAFSRQRPQSTQLVRLDEEVIELEPMLARLLGDKVTLETRAEKDLWHVLVDPAQFEQVIVNLAVNARDAMPRGGELIIRLTNVMDHPVTDDAVMVTVADTGEGMSKEVLAHLFEPFYTTKPRGEGTGLGLSTVYGIMTQLGGHITVESQPGEGAVFKLLFPRAEAPGRYAEDAQGAVHTTGGTEQILVVEDEPLVRQAAVRMLSKRGYTVHEAGCGSDALELLESVKGFDLMLCDVVMPEMSGPEVYEALRASNPDLKVVFMTGYAEDVKAFKDLVEREGLTVLNKPFETQELLMAVRDELDK